MYSSFRMPLACVTQPRPSRPRHISQRYSKDNPLPVTLGFLNTYFSKLAMVHTLNGRPPQEMASALKVNPFFVKDYVAQARNYSLGKLVE